MNVSPRFAAFLFDMDGTILTSIDAAERVWGTWAERHGIDPATFLPKIHGMRAIDTIRKYGPPGINAEAEAAALTEAEIADVAGIVGIAGAAQFLGSLPRGKWAIVTSAPRDLATRRIEAAGLPMPDLLIAAEDVENGKPAPDGYLLAANRLGVSADDCLIFEDAAAGIAAAEAAGAAIIVITASHKTACMTQHPSFPDYLRFLVTECDPPSLGMDIRTAPLPGVLPGRVDHPEVLLFQELHRVVGPAQFIDYVDRGYGADWCHVSAKHAAIFEGGRRVHGWSLWLFDTMIDGKTRQFVMGDHHSVWRTSEGELMDVTPPKFGERRVLFLEDGTATIDDVDDRYELRTNSTSISGQEYFWGGEPTEHPRWSLPKDSGDLLAYAASLGLAPSKIVTDAEHG